MNDKFEFNKDSRYLILIPAYNEEQSIEKLIERSTQYADVCVIDDSSNDRTPEILSEYSETIKVMRHSRNTHIPGVLLDGIRYALEQEYDYMITIDAGLSHDPDEIPLFMRAPSNCDLVIGARKVNINTPLYRRLLSIAGNMAYNNCLNPPRSLLQIRKYSDLTSGYRRYSNYAMNLILSKKIESKKIEILLETTAIIHRNGLSICEVPITYNYSNTYFKLANLKDCMEMYLTLLVKPRFGLDR